MNTAISDGCVFKRVRRFIPSVFFSEIHLLLRRVLNSKLCLSLAAFLIIVSTLTIESVGRMKPAVKVAVIVAVKWQLRESVLVEKIMSF